jgi:hypothetical protein
MSLILDIKKTRPLTNSQVQTLIDAEPFFGDHGIALELWCIPCRRAGEPHECSGDYDGRTFKVTCSCSVRAYTGDDLTVPVSPTWKPRQKPIDTVENQKTVALSRQTMQFLATFEQCLDSLQMQYRLRCLQCHYNGDPDGITGVQESSAMQQMFACACTKRIYVGADAPSTIH